MRLPVAVPAFNEEGSSSSRSVSWLTVRPRGGATLPGGACTAAW
jgi:hypothetical protein